MANPTNRTIDEVMTDIDERLGTIERGTSTVDDGVDVAGAMESATNPLVEKMSSIHASMMKYFRFQELHVDDNEREDDGEHEERVGLLRQIVNGLSGMFGGNGGDDEEETKGGILDSIKGIFGSPVKGLGGLVRLLTRLGGPLAAIGAIISFAQGFKDAESIIGRDGLNIIERVGAGVANLIADLMGIVTSIANFFLPENMQLSTLFDASEIYLGIEKVGKFIMEMFEWIDTNVMEPIRAGFGWLITNVTPTKIMETIDNISAFMAESWETLTTTINDFKESVSTFISDIVGKVIETATNVFNFYKSIPGRLWDAISGIYNVIFDLLGFEQSFTEMSQKVFDGVTGFASSIIDKIVEFIDGIKESILGVFDDIKLSIQSKIDALADLGDKVAGFFGFGDDDEDTLTPSGTNADGSTDASAAQAALALENFNDLPTDLPPPPTQQGGTNISTNVDNSRPTLLTAPVSGGNANSYSRIGPGPKAFVY